MPDDAPPAGRLLHMVAKAPEAEPVDEVAGAEALLLDILEQIQSGQFKPRMLVVHTAIETPQQTLKHYYWTWNIRPLEHLGLLDMARYSVMATDNPPI